MKKYRLRLALMAVLVALIGGTIELLVWSSRPNWRTYTFPADPKTGSAVAIDYPDSMEFNPTYAPGSVFKSDMGLSLAPKPSKGLMHWWQTQVLHQKQEDNVGILLFVLSEDRYQSRTDIEKFVSDITATPGTTLTVIHTRHALGPAMEAQGILGNGILGNSRANNEPPPQVHGVAIWPQAATGSGKVSLLMVGIAPAPRFWQIGSAVNGMIQRIHLVRTSGAAHHP